MTKGEKVGTVGRSWYFPKTSDTAGRISYAALIDACGKARQWRKALELFGEMEQSQWLPQLAM